MLAGVCFNLTSLSMKIRVLLLTLVCSLAFGTGAYAANKETELGSKMEKMGGAFRALRRQINDASKNEDSLAKLKTIRDMAEASIKLDPAMKADKPAGDQAKFVADYQADMKKFLAKVDATMAALKAGKNDEAAKLCNELGDLQKAGHKQYKKPDEKKK